MGAESLAIQVVDRHIGFREIEHTHRVVGQDP